MGAAVDERTQYVTVYIRVKPLHISRDEIYKRVEEKLQARRERNNVIERAAQAAKPVVQREGCEESYTERLRRIVEKKRDERKKGDDVVRKEERKRGERVERKEERKKSPYRRGDTKELIDNAAEVIHKANAPKDDHDFSPNKRKSVIDDILKREETRSMEKGKLEDDQSEKADTSFGVSSAYEVPSQSELEELKRKLALTEELLKDSNKRPRQSAAEQRRASAIPTPSPIKSRLPLHKRYSTATTRREQTVARKISLEAVEPRVADFVSASEVSESGSSLSSLSQELEDLRISRREAQDLTVVTAVPSKDPPPYQGKHLVRRRSTKGSELGWTDEEIARFEAEADLYNQQIDLMDSSLDPIPSEHTMSDISNPFSGSEPYHDNIDNELEHASRYVSSDDGYSICSEPISHDEAKSMLQSSERLYQHMLAASLEHTDDIFEEEGSLLGRSGSSSDFSGEPFTPEQSSSTRRMTNPVSRRLEESSGTDSEMDYTVVNEESEPIIFVDTTQESNFFVHETSPRFVPKKSPKKDSISNRAPAKKPTKNLTVQKPVTGPSKKNLEKPSAKKVVVSPKSAATVAVKEKPVQKSAPTVRPVPKITKTPVKIQAKVADKPIAAGVSATKPNTNLVKPAVKSPLKPPEHLAVKSPIKSPIKSPVQLKSPIKSTVKLSEKPPAKSPEKTPVKTPLKPPLKTPVKTLVEAKTPVKSPPKPIARQSAATTTPVGLRRSSTDASLKGFASRRGSTDYVSSATKSEKPKGVAETKPDNAFPIKKTLPSKVTKPVDTSTLSSAVIVKPALTKTKDVSPKPVSSKAPSNTLVSTKPSVISNSSSPSKPTVSPAKPSDSPSPTKASSKAYVSPYSLNKLAVTPSPSKATTKTSDTPSPTKAPAKPSAASSPATVSAKASVTPAKASVTPAKASVTPATASVTPAKASVTPAKASVTPAKASVTPAKASVTPAKASVASAKASVAPAKASVTPAKASVTPAKASVASAKASVTPAKASVTPAKASVTPAKASVTPAKSPVVPSVTKTLAKASITQSPSSKPTTKPSPKSPVTPNSLALTPKTMASKASSSTKASTGGTLPPVSSLEDMEYKPKSPKPVSKQKLAKPTIASGLAKPQGPSKTALNTTLSPKPASKASPALKASPVVKRASFDSEKSPASKMSTPVSPKVAPPSPKVPPSKPNSSAAKPTSSISKPSPLAPKTTKSALNKTLSPNLKTMEYTTKIPSPRTSSKPDTPVALAGDIVMKPQRLSATGKSSKLPSPKVSPKFPKR